MVNHEIHATHTCFACSHLMSWTGDIFGGILVTHGNEIDATITLTGEKGDFVEMDIQLQCPECGSVNQFKGYHHK